MIKNFECTLGWSIAQLEVKKAAKTHFLYSIFMIIIKQMHCFQKLSRSPLDGQNSVKRSSCSVTRISISIISISFFIFVSLVPDCLFPVLSYLCIFSNFLNNILFPLFVSFCISFPLAETSFVSLTLFNPNISLELIMIMI